jgi:hypothetical protein
MIIIIIIFLHGLGRLTSSGIDALSSFPVASTISFSSRFVVEGVDQPSRKNGQHPWNQIHKFSYSPEYF